MIQKSDGRGSKFFRFWQNVDPNSLVISSEVKSLYRVEPLSVSFAISRLLNGFGIFNRLQAGIKTARIASVYALIAPALRKGVSFSVAQSSAFLNPLIFLGFLAGYFRNSSRNCSACLREISLNLAS